MKCLLCTQQICSERAGVRFSAFFNYCPFSPFVFLKWLLTDLSTSASLSHFPSISPRSFRQRQMAIEISRTADLMISYTVQLQQKQVNSADMHIQMFKLIGPALNSFGKQVMCGWFHGTNLSTPSPAILLHISLDIEPCACKRDSVFKSFQADVIISWSENE